MTTCAVGTPRRKTSAHSVQRALSPLIRASLRSGSFPGKRSQLCEQALECPWFIPFEGIASDRPAPLFPQGSKRQPEQHIRARPVWSKTLQDPSSSLQTASFQGGGWSGGRQRSQ